jgi:hypothetical protein
MTLTKVGNLHAWSAEFEKKATGNYLMLLYHHSPNVTTENHENPVSKTK